MTVPAWITQYWVLWIFGLIAAGLTAWCKRISATIKRDKEERKAQMDCIRWMMGQQLISLCEESIAQGYCSASRKNEIVKGYDAYHKLGGNGAVTALKDHMMALPTR